MSMLMLDYQREGRSWPRAGVALLLAAVAWVAAIGAAYYDLGRAAAAWQGTPAAPGARPAPVVIAPQGAAEMRVQAQEIRQANAVLRELSVPWESLFAAVEASAHRDVALLSMEPDTKKQVVKIAGEARNLGAVLDYMRRLGRQPLLRDVHLQRHAVDQEDPEHPVRFDLMASWITAP